MPATGFELHPIDSGIIVAYALLMIGLGLYFGRKHDSATDYFLAGRRMIWPLIGISWRQGPHQGAQKSTRTGTCREGSITS